MHRRNFIRKTNMSSWTLLLTRKMREANEMDEDAEETLWQLRRTVSSSSTRKQLPRDKNRITDGVTGL